MRHFFLATFGVLFVFTWSTSFGGQEVRGPFKVTIKDGKAALGEPTMPIDQTPRIASQYSGQNSFGLTVEGKRITCSPNGSIWGSLMVDGNISNPFNEGGGRIVQPSPLPASPSGKKRLGTQSSWNHASIHVTQIIETVPSKSSL